MPGNLTNDLSHICFIPRSGLRLQEAEWNPIGYHASNSMLEFGINAFRVCDRHPFVEQIAAGSGIPVWTPCYGATLI